MTKREMQSRWVLMETYPEHGRDVGRVACQSYVTDSPQCERSDWAGKTRNVDGTVVIYVGNSPFTELLDLKYAQGHLASNGSWMREEAIRMGAKIATVTSGGTALVRQFENGIPPYLVVLPAGNYSSDFSWLQDGSLFDSTTQHSQSRQWTRTAIAADKLLFVAGYDKNAAGNYVRHWESSGCRDSELTNGCLWTQYEFPGVFRGTSLSAPQLSAALASVLAVFPDTTPENLSRFAKASAKKTGNGIPALLAQSGGVGVADFNSMGKIVSALRDLPTGGSTNVSIDGQSVTMSGRRISLGSAIRNAPLTASAISLGGESAVGQAPTPLTPARKKERDGVSFNFIRPAPTPACLPPPNEKATSSPQRHSEPATTSSVSPTDTEK